MNNHSRKIWIILLKKQTNAIKVLRKWRLTIELKIEIKLLTIRSDNALKLKFILDEWEKFTNIETQYNEVHTFKQNEIFERDIRITKNNIRVMIKKTNLFIEFWSKTATIDIYIRNRVGTSSIMNKKKSFLSKLSKKSNHRSITYAFEIMFVTFLWISNFCSSISKKTNSWIKIGDAFFWIMWKKRISNTECESSISKKS